MAVEKQEVLGITGYRAEGFDFSIGKADDGSASVSIDRSPGFKFISHDEYDLDCRMSRTLHATFYNSQNEVINSYNRSYADFEDIIPGSNGEAVYDAVVMLMETRENARRL